MNAKPSDLEYADDIMAWLKTREKDIMEYKGQSPQIDKRFLNTDLILTAPYSMLPTLQSGSLLLFIIMLFIMLTNTAVHFIADKPRSS